MKKILLFLVALVATLSMNAQTTEIHNASGKVAAYLGADVTVKFGMDGSDPTIMVYKGDVWQETYKGSEYKVVSTPVEETFKAVYDTNGGANTLTFYYDAVDHSGNGITVYQDGTANYLFDNAQSEGAKWGYNDVRVNVSKVEIDESVKKYEDLTSTAYMFKNMVNATGISGAEYLDVANVTDMSNMFERYGFSSTDLNAVPNVSGWNTGNVKNMANMFNQYGNNSTSLTVVPDVSGWNTGNVKNMANMFYRYGNTSASFNAVPNVSEWKTDSLTDMNKMFYQYGYNSTSLTVVPDVSGWKTGNVTNMDDLFNCYGYKSTSLTVVPDVSKWNTGNVKNMGNMFYGYGYNSTSLTVVPDVSGWNTDKVTNMTGLFRSYGYKSTSLTVVPDVSGWKTGNVTNMDRLFDSYGYYSTSLTVVPNVSKWNTGNVENMGNMFYRYGYKSGSLNAVPNVSKWNTGNVTDMSGIFDSYGYNSTSLAAFPAVSGWNTGNVKKMGNMFFQYGNQSGNIECELDLSGWNLANVTSGAKVFDFKPKTFSVTIPAKTGDKVNDASHWYYGNGSKSITPPSGKSFMIGQGYAAVNAGAGITGNKVKWVQLWEGGPKFAEFNVGVTDGKAESYGGYYCWGKTVDQDSKGAYKGGTSALTGTDDTATNLWGSNWRMPTKDEFGALLNNCTCTWTTNYNGIGADGLLCTGKDAYSSNSVFLPAAGYCYFGDVFDQGDYGAYWSSTPRESYNNRAYDLYFDSVDQLVINHERSRGYSVRAVLAK